MVVIGVVYLGRVWPGSGSGSAAAPAEEPHQTRWPEEPLLPIHQRSRSPFARTEEEPGFVALQLWLRLPQRSTTGGAWPNTA